jgi:hypothetical protein
MRWQLEKGPGSSLNREIRIVERRSSRKSESGGDIGKEGGE